MVFGESDTPYVLTTADSLKRGNIAHEVFMGHEANRRFPHQMKIPDTHMCVLEEDGGILNAQRILKTLQVDTFLNHTFAKFNLHALAATVPEAGWDTAGQPQSDGDHSRRSGDSGH